MKNKTDKPSCWKDYNKKLSWKPFLEYIKPFRHIRAGVKGNTPPFDLTYFKITKSELIKTIRMHQSQVTFDVMVDTNNPADIGIMFIKKIEHPILTKMRKVNTAKPLKRK